jgi:hypothetical protein
MVSRITIDDAKGYQDEEIDNGRASSASSNPSPAILIRHSSWHRDAPGSASMRRICLLEGIDARFRGAFAYISARLPDGDSMPLMRLRYGGSAARWGFAIYLASNDGYQDSVLPTGHTAGAPEDAALDTACGLYLGDPTAWT